MKTKKLIMSMLLMILIFFSFINPVKANLFTDDEKSKVEETIEKDEGRTI